MSHRIFLMPVNTVKDLSIKCTSYPFPLKQESASFWYGARQAIYQGVRCLGLQKGDRVLVPAYSCGSEIDSLLKAGMIPDFYRILSDLSPDFKHMESLCKNSAKALFITHYFGFSQPMEPIIAFARKYGMLLIEDNAHGLYSTDNKDRPLGSFGDIGVFSFTKSLPLPDGGALVFKQKDHRKVSPPICRHPDTPKVALKTAWQAKHSINEMIGRRLPYLMNTIDKKLAYPLIDKLKLMGTYELEEQSVDWGMSPASRFLVRYQHHSSIRKIRRRNFMTLLNHFEGGKLITPLINHLPNGCCPLFFPVKAKYAEPFHRFLIANGVISTRFWPSFHEVMPKELFPFESMLKHCVVEIPIHQDLNEGDMMYIVNLLKKWDSKKSIDSMN